MKIIVINGSPKGNAGNTHVLVNAFLDGAQEAGAETKEIFLSEMDIKHCKGCHTCWTKGPGQCVTEDDMLSILSNMGGADIIAFATPVYFGNISGMLKVFMDRMTMIGSPHNQNDIKERRQEVNPKETKAPKLMMIASCGFPDRNEFEVVSLWINKVAQKMHMDLIGEIYATQGKLLKSPPEELQPIISDYLLGLARAGKEIATTMKLSETTKKHLMQSFITK